MTTAIDSLALTVNLAMDYHRAGKLAQAEQIYRSVLAEQPDHVDANYLLGLIELDRGKFSVAVELIERAGRKAPNNPLHLLNLGRALEGEGKPAEAEKCYQKAVRLRPEDVEARYALANLWQNQGRLLAAVKEYRRILKQIPDSAGVYNNLGNALQNLGRLEEAEQALQKAVTLDPNYGQGFGNLGNLLLTLGRFQDADAAFQKALSLNPNAPDIHYNYANLLQLMCRYDVSVGEYLKAIELNPRMVGAHNNLGNLLKLLGHLKDAEACFRNAIHYDPQYVDPYNNLGNTLVSRGDIEQAILWYREAVRLKPMFADAYSNLIYSLNYPVGIPEQEIYREHREWSRRFERPILNPKRPKPRPAEGRRLRIGYLSPDFRRHSVAFFFEPLLEAHDRSRVEVFCYANVAAPDEVTQRIEAHAEHWRPIHNLNDDQAAALIREDRIDILVDLAGHTDRNRLMIFPRRPAPVQVNWLGYPNTTGLDAFDYRLVDAITDPPGYSDRFASETLQRLPSGFLCYRGYEEAPPVAPTPCLENGHITFGSFNNLTKVTRKVVDLWCRILKELPTARLILKSHQLEDQELRDHYVAWFQENGIDPARVEMFARIPGLADHLNFYGRVDIALDSFPYNGTTTTCEALWMGVPVLAMDGNSHRARVSKSILHRIGLPELVAADEAGLLAKAVALAGQPQRLQEMRQGMRARMGQSPLCDERGFAADMEQLFAEMQARALAGG